MISVPKNGSALLNFPSGEDPVDFEKSDGDKMDSGDEDEEESDGEKADSVDQDKEDSDDHGQEGEEDSDQVNEKAGRPDDQDGTGHTNVDPEKDKDGDEIMVEAGQIEHPLPPASLDLHTQNRDFDDLQAFLYHTEHAEARIGDITGVEESSIDTEHAPALVHASGLDHDSQLPVEDWYRAVDVMNSGRKDPGFTDHPLEKDLDVISPGNPIFSSQEVLQMARNLRSNKQKRDTASVDENPTALKKPRVDKPLVKQNVTSLLDGFLFPVAGLLTSPSALPQVVLNNQIGQVLTYGQIRNELFTTFMSPGYQGTLLGPREATIRTLTNALIKLKRSDIQLNALKHIFETTATEIFVIDDTKTKSQIQAEMMKHMSICREFDITRADIARFAGDFSNASARVVSLMRSVGKAKPQKTALALNLKQFHCWVRLFNETAGLISHIRDMYHTTDFDISMRQTVCAILNQQPFQGSEAYECNILPCPHCNKDTVAEDVDEEMCLTCTVASTKTNLALPNPLPSDAKEWLAHLAKTLQAKQ